MTSRDWADKNYYADLGVSSTATAAEIKKAYRKLARENHPDNNPGDKHAEERFKRAAEAYDVLGEEPKRKEYDQFKAMLASGGMRGFGGKGGPGFPGGFQQSAQGFDVSDLFGGARQAGFSADGSLGDIFGGIFNRGGASHRAATPSRGANVETSITLDFREAALGTSLPIELTRNISCPDCNGSGSASGKRSQCADCGGSGYASENKGAFGFSAPCTTCGATGEVVTDPCSRCHGSGIVAANQPITIKVPAGIKDGARLRIAGKGEAGPQGRPSGDLFVTVHIRPDRVFTRDGNDLEVVVPVSFTEVALGTTLSIPTLGDPVRVKIKAGTPNGRRLRLKGKGIPAKNGAGDLYATVDVVVPSTLDERSTQLLTEFAAAQKDAGVDPRASWPGN